MHILLLLSAIAGILLLVGTMLLLWFRRIYIDAQTGQPTEIEIPLIGKFRTHAPAFALIIVGAILVIYPIYNAPKQDLIKIEGTVDPGGKSVTVLVLALPTNLLTLDSAGPFDMWVPLIKDASYRVKFIVDKQVLLDCAAKRDEKGVYKVNDFRWAAPPAGEFHHVRPTREEVTDEEIRRLGIN